MSKKVKLTITAVCKWELDDWEYEGTASHIGEREATKLQWDEEDEKIESLKWDDEHLPYSFTISPFQHGVTEEDVDEDELHGECIDRLRDKLCSGDMYQPEECEFDYEIVED